MHSANPSIGAKDCVKTKPLIERKGAGEPRAYTQDLALVRRMLAGEEAAFEACFEGCFDGLYRFALLRLGSDEDAAEEVAQAALCAAFRKLNTYRGEAALFTWLCTFCRHEISAYCKRRSRSPVVFGEAEETPELQSVLEALSEAVTEQPEEAYRHKELGGLVREALVRLPPHYGDALEWKYVEDRSVAEIAERLKVGLKAAESLLTRAREAFRASFNSVCKGQALDEME